MMPLDAEDIGLAELFQAQRERHEANEKRVGAIADRVHRSLRWQAFALGAYAATLVLTIAALILLYEQRSSDRGNQARAQCAALSVVIDAGRKVIVSQTAQPVPPREERTLERLGFPPLEVRRQQAERAADRYAAKIASAIRQQASVPGVVRRNGSLNCERFAGVSG